ncbi:hypothetical protein BDZ89DRAFT_1130881 [Hymenopellis radicata]|nr:hypothetical protein BDZ89DRAFT_1130881 [Hymenopellis radicata]
MFTKVVFAALALIVVQAQVDDCARTYTVVAGDFCDAISAANNASTYQLAHVNPGPQINAGCTNIFAGETLCLGEVGQDCNETYVIASGDACGAIASTFGIGLDVLLANNPNVNAACSNIYPGEVLCVADAEVYV